MNPLLKLALDLGPLAVFFTGNAYFGIMPATGMFMVATILSLGVSYSIEKKLSPMPIVTGIVVMVFGGLTLWLNNDLFIKLKPTIVNSIFAALLIGGLLSGRLFLKFLLDSAFQMPDDAWRKFTYRWIWFFVFLALLNEFIWRNYSTDFWVGFKLWGVFPISLLFALAQTPFLMKHQIKTSNDETPKAA
ncbi:MAG: septation protein A [Alphaproteobacteria bacterium]|nr:septation protein A [Alphaproteobacteria bacterium]